MDSGRRRVAAPAQAPTTVLATRVGTRVGSSGNPRDGRTPGTASPAARTDPTGIGRRTVSGSRDRTTTRTGTGNGTVGNTGRRSPTPTTAPRPGVPMDRALTNGPVGCRTRHQKRSPTTVTGVRPRNGRLPRADATWVRRGGRSSRTGPTVGPSHRVEALPGTTSRRGPGNRRHGPTVVRRTTGLARLSTAFRHRSRHGHAPPSRRRTPCRHPRTPSRCRRTQSRHHLAPSRHRHIRSRHHPAPSRHHRTPPRRRRVPPGHQTPSPAG
ncbi:hypothetical protein FHR38_004811 [Micromonospora polyrhachis]|uniref:Uncharacterized protein n=1 Tax=Micromonospora polyrhachis TaxID=1282883 RepID=A0A7W7SUA0_9ACTN|nr:hypothetical protein [Micromonospora polyrhachis]